MTSAQKVSNIYSDSARLSSRLAYQEPQFSKKKRDEKNPPEKSFREVLKAELTKDQN